MSHFVYNVLKVKESITLENVYTILQYVNLNSYYIKRAVESVFST
jgi:hypothetical protein